MFNKKTKCGVLTVGVILLMSLSVGYIAHFDDVDTTSMTAAVQIREMNDLNVIRNAGGSVLIREGMNVLIEGNPTIFSFLESEGMEVEVFERADEDTSVNSTVQQSEYPFAEHYPSVDELNTWYDDLITEHPNLVSKVNIGSSWEGRDLWVIEVTSEEDTQVEYKPGFLVDGAMHAREWSSVQTSSYLMWRLLNEYDTNETINWLVNNRRIYVMPMVNPDGYIYDSDGDYGNQNNWRKNRNDSTPTDNIGVDLNRNWDHHWEDGNDDPRGTDYRGEAPFSEYETKSLRDFILDNNINTYQNIHSYAGTMLIPWCNSTHPSPHDSWYRGMAEHMTSLTSIMGDESEHYSYGQPGHEIGYSAPGGAGDWVYNNTGAFSMVFELETGGHGFYPPPEEIMTINKDVDDSLIYQGRIADIDLGDGTDHLYPPVPYIVYGMVENSLGEPVVDITISIENTNTGESISILTNNNGYYELNYGSLVEYGYTIDDTFTITADTHSEEFTIGDEWGQRIDIELVEEGDPPDITLARPNGGETFTAGTSEEIIWDTTAGDDPIDYVDIWYSTDSGSTWNTTASGIDDTGSYMWTVPNEHSADCLVRVRVSDTLGRTGEDTSDGTFTIEGLPPAPPSNLNVEHYGTSFTALFEDDVESGDLGYTTGTSESPASEWGIRQHGASSGVNSWDFGDGEYYKTSDYGYLSWLISPGIEIPAEAGNVELTFDHWRSFAALETYLDGGNLKISTTGVDGDYTLITPLEGYDGVINDAYGNPLGGQEGWSDVVGWETVTFDLNYYAGETVHLRWDAGIEAYDDDIEEGWRIDNILITAETAGEGDDHNLLTWNASPDDPDEVAHYNIYRSEFSDGPWDETTLLDSVEADGSVNYTYLDENKGMADEIFWWYVIRAVGTNGLEEQNEDAVQEPGDTLVTFDIPLYAGGDAGGWNFVSFNLIPPDSSLEAILEDPDYGISGNYEKVMYYDAVADSWYTYVPGRAARFNSLENWDHRMGVWIRMTANDVLTIEGTEPGETSITLQPGWNMVGLPSSTGGNHGLPTEVSRIGYFVATEEYNLAYDHDPGNFAFAPGEGYWVYNDVDYTVDWIVEY